MLRNQVGTCLSCRNLFSLCYLLPGANLDHRQCARLCHKPPHRHHQPRVGLCDTRPLKKEKKRKKRKENPGQLLERGEF
ncbi:hypothetical protein LI328DRAFT_137188 [Trichoderma asperelloides]|nr:hypothetical protein LI328DRAFT_137188 [Trichoderma asperelloides]